MRSLPLNEAKNDLSNILKQAAREPVLITVHGRTAGILIGFETEDDWFEYRLLNDPRFLNLIEKGRKDIKTGKGIRFEDVDQKTRKAKSKRRST